MKNSGGDVAVQKHSHFLRNFLIIFLSVLLCAFAVLGAISVYRNAKTLMRYGGTACDEPTYRYLSSYYKLMHMRALADTEGAEDTEAFWQSTEPESGKTQGALLAEGAKNYISRVLISAALYDQTASSAQKREAKAAAKKAVEEILTYQANGSEESFNALTAPYGYAYDDLYGIALLLYKAERAQSLFYGASGETASTRVTECDQYLKNNYAAVKLLFIRSETTYNFTLNENGEKDILLDDNKEPILRALTAEELAQREALMADLDERIAAQNLTAAYFSGRMGGHYESYAEGQSGLYYFANGSAYTEQYKKQEGGAEIVKEALALKNNACKKIAYKDGFCYIFKYETETGAFAEKSYELYFSDFYINVANYLFSKDVSLFMDDIVISERAEKISLTALPYKNLIRVRF